MLGSLLGRSRRFTLHGLNLLRALPRSLYTITRLNKLTSFVKRGGRHRTNQSRAAHKLNQVAPTWGEIRLLCDVSFGTYFKVPGEWDYSRDPPAGFPQVLQQEPRSEYNEARVAGNKARNQREEVFRHIQGVGSFQEKLVETFCQEGLPLMTIQEDLGVYNENTKAVDKPQRREFTIAIRGSSNTSDWVRNFTLGLARYKDPDVKNLKVSFHKGFMDAAKELLLEVERVLRTLGVGPGGCKLRLAGHSLGGAVAVIIAAILSKKGYDISKVVTFGQPMVTDKAGAKILNDFVPLYRVIFKNDAVPSLPPSIFQYRHFGYSCHLKGDLPYNKIPKSDAESLGYLATESEVTVTGMAIGIKVHSSYEQGLVGAKNKLSADIHQIYKDSILDPLSLRSSKFSPWNTVNVIEAGRKLVMSEDNRASLTKRQYDFFIKKVLALGPGLLSRQLLDGLLEEVKKVA